ncbi:MAG: TonB family protein [Candidatus Acidiferrum sp.]
MASAANTNSSGSPSASSQPASKLSPVAHEAVVIATGARPGGKDGKRELFKESTTTALVFPNGGVIRLPVAVNPGQLIFLSIPQTKREVVAQVTKRRDNPGAGYYVELEFTEPAPDFWGVKFSETPEEAPANVAPSPAAQIMQAPAPASGEPDVEPPPPSEDEVHALMEEVEALRAELKSRQTQSAPAPSASLASAPQVAAMLSSLLAAAPAAQQASTASEHSQPAVQAPPAESSSAAHEQFDSEEVTEHRPEVSAKKTKAPKEVAATAHPPAAAPDRSGTLRLALLAAVSLFAVFAAAWNMRLLPWTSNSLNVPGRASAPLRPAANLSSHARTTAQLKPAAALDPNAPAPAANAASVQPNPADPSAAQPSATSPDATSSNTATAGSASSSDASSNSSPREDSAPVTPVAKRSVVPRSSASDASAALPDDATGIVPPELIKSVRAVAPADALRQFVTGNVTLDAVVDKAGHVESMKVLSGPASFHKAAMEALKQYRYKPARQNGKAVAAHVTVTVPFWFEP